MSTLIPVSGQHTGLYTGPYFAGLSLSRVMNITAVLGHTVHLPCHVKQLGTNALAWVRNRDSSILSIDTDIITHDSRFRIVDSEDKQDWVLIIRWVAEACTNSSELYKMSNYPVFNYDFNLLYRRSIIMEDFLLCKEHNNLRSHPELIILPPPTDLLRMAHLCLAGGQRGKLIQTSILKT